MSHKPLKPALRRKWDNLIATEGAKMGLTDCIAFLENKMLNDIFYRGKFKGQPCVVKCSSRAPDSISNEYELSLRLYQVDSGVVARPLARWCSTNEKYAFVITEALPGTSLAQELAGSPSQTEQESITADLIRIAEALTNAGIVWRDLITSNLYKDSTGHYRLIDAQLAIDRADPRECRFMRKNRLYRLILFAYNKTLHGRGWCDADFLKLILEQLAPGDTLFRALARLDELRPQMTALYSITILDKIYLSFIRAELTIQLWLRGKNRSSTVRERLMRINNLLEVEHD